MFSAPKLTFAALAYIRVSCTPGTALKHTFSTLTSLFTTTFYESPFSTVLNFAQSVKLACNIGVLEMSINNKLIKYYVSTLLNDEFLKFKY